MEVAHPLAPNSKVKNCDQLELNNSSNEILVSIAKRKPLQEVLKLIVAHCEKNDGMIKASILLYNKATDQLSDCVAPSLPEEYLAVLPETLPLGPDICTCGAAAYERKLIISENLATNANWQNFPDIAQKAIDSGFHACWSLPFFSSKGELLGTVANYSIKTGEPNLHNLEVLEWVANVTAIAVEQDETEKKLALSHAKYKSIVSASSELVLVLDELDRVIDVHYTSQSNLPVSSDGSGSHISDFLPDSAIAQYEETAKAVRQKGENSRYEYSAIEQDKQKYFAASVNLLDSDGKLVVDIRETTASKIRDKEFKEQYELFKLISENMQDYIGVLGLDMKPIYASPSLFNRLGYSKEEFSDLPFEKLMTPDSYENFSNLVGDNLTPEKLQDPKCDIAFEGVLEVIRKDGSFYWCHSYNRLIRDEEGKPKYILEVGRDITKQKQAEDRLLRQGKLFESVSIAVHALLSESNINLAIQMALSEIGRATGQDRVYIFEHHHNPLTSESLMSHRYEWAKDGISLQIDSPELQNLSFDNLFPRWLKALKQGKSISGNVADFPKSERDILQPQDIISLMVLPIHIEGYLWGFIGLDNCHIDYEWGSEDQSILMTMASSVGSAIMRHRSEQLMREANRKFAQATEKAKAASKAKSGFLANMSHEIRTPMNAIIGLTQLSLKTQLDHQQRNYIQKIGIASESLLSIINDILDFSKIEAEKLTLELTPFVLQDVLRRVITLQQKHAADKHIELLLDIKSNDVLDNGGCFIGDSLRIEQILTNLITNAIKFTENRGSVLIQVETFKQSQGMCTLEIYVEDNGIGMDEETIQNLFQKFTQSDETTTRRFGGTGLGLSIVKHLLTMMGGSISAKSVPSEGSRFTMQLPLQIDQSMEQVSMAFVSADITGHALIIEDHESASIVLQALLKHYGVTSEWSASGDIALAVLEDDADRFDYVFVDWVMPGLSGESLVATINQYLKEEQNLIITSAYDIGDIHRLCEQQIISNYLSKPVVPDDLHKILAPIEVPAAITDADHKEPESSLLKGAYVLVVEDNLINQEIAVEMLADSGAIVECADNGTEALASLDTACKENKSFDIVLMDIQMPVMDGYTATKKIREDARFDSLPIIALTANAMVEEMGRCLEAGMDTHMSKPFKQADLISVINEQLSSSRKVKTTQIH